MTLSSNKRGNVMFEVFTLAIVIFAIGFILIAASIVSNKVNEAIQSNPEFANANDSKIIMEDFNNNYPKIGDGIIVTLFIGLWIVALIGAFLIDSHPVFFIFSVILLSVFVLVGGYLSDAWTDATTTSALAPYAAEFPMTNFIFGHIIASLVVIGFSIMLVLYGKNRVLT